MPQVKVKDIEVNTPNSRDAIYFAEGMELLVGQTIEVIDDGDNYYHYNNFIFDAEWLEF